MQRKPRDPRAGIFTRPVVAMLLVAGLWSAVVNLGVFTSLLWSGRPLGEVMAITFVTLVLIQFFNAYNCRSDRLPIVRAPFANRWLNMAVAWEVALLAVIVYTPFLQEPFGTFSLSPRDWLMAAAGAFTVVPAVETVKWMARRGWFGELR